MRIHQLKLRVSNAYLILAQRPILVDTGSPNNIGSIRSILRGFNTEFKDLGLVVHTHIHSDHMGCTAQIAAEGKCPIAYHRADQPIVDRSDNGQLKGVGLRGRIMSRFFSYSKFAAVHSDVDLQDGMSLKDYGANVTVLATPGHTQGSVSFLTPEGDAIIGDVIMGGYLGGNFLPTHPNFHYFADDINQAMTSLDRVLSHAKRTLYVGHGGPLTLTTVRSWRLKQKNKG